MVLTSEPQLATYTELDTVLSVTDLRDMLEILDARAEILEVDRLTRPQQ